MRSGVQFLLGVSLVACSGEPPEVTPTGTPGTPTPTGIGATGVTPTTTASVPNTTTGTTPTTSVTGPSTCGVSEPLLDQAIVRIDGGPNDALGQFIGAAGDVDGDGFGDVLVPAWQHNDSGLARIGAVWVISGAALAGATLDTALITMEGLDASEMLGLGAATAGDTNGDGMADLLIGAAGANAGSGQIYLVESPHAAGFHPAGVATLTIVGDPMDGLAKTSPPSDVDGNGVADLWVSSQTAGGGEGVAYLFRNPGTGTLLASDADVTIRGAADDLLGRTAQAGDVNGDGLADLLLGADDADLNGSESGGVWVLHGPVADGVHDAATLESHVYGPTGSIAGHGTAGAGDVDGDGLDDFIVGAPYESTHGLKQGRAYVVLSDVLTPTALDTEVILDGADPGDRVGFSVAGIGDINSDGFADVAVGAKFHDLAGNDAGVAYVVLGPLSGVVDMEAVGFKMLGEGAGDHAGVVVEGGDLDGNGVPDLLVGAREIDAGGPGAGAVYVLGCGLPW